MRLHWLSLRFNSAKLEDGFQRHWAASLLQADAWCLLALLLGLLLRTLHMRLSFAAAEGASVCSNDTHLKGWFSSSSSSPLVDACSREQQLQQKLQQPVLVQQLRMACTAGAAMCGLACMATLLLRHLRRACYVQQRTAALAACAGLTAAVSLCGRAAVLQAGIGSSTACFLEALGVLLFVVYAIPFVWALPAVAAYWGASTLLLQTAAPTTAEPGQYLLQQPWLGLLLLFVPPLVGLYVLERHARLSCWMVAAAAACEDGNGCCDGHGCDTADRTPSGSEQQIQHQHHNQHQHQHQRLRQHHHHRQQQRQQQQEPEQRGMAVLAPVTFQAGSGAVPVPAALGYSSVFQRSVLAIKVQAPATANYEEVQQVQQRIATTLQSVLATRAVPAVLAGTIAFPGCVHIMCTFASQLSAPHVKPQQKQKPDNEVGLFAKEGLQQQLAAVLPGGCIVTAVQHLPGAVAETEATNEAPAAALALQPAALSIDDSSSCGMGTEPRQLRLAFAPGLAGKLQQQGYKQLRVVVGSEQHAQQLLLLDCSWELDELLQSAVIEFELEAAKLAAVMPQQQQQEQQLGCLCVAVLACKQLHGSGSADKRTGSGKPSSRQEQHVQPAELVLGLLPLPLLPAANAKELQQLQALAEARDTGPVHVYTSVMLPVLQDLQCAILLRGNGTGSSSSGSNSGKSSHGSESSSGSECGGGEVGRSGQPNGVDMQLVMSALVAYFERHKLSACCQTLQQMHGSGSTCTQQQQQQQQEGQAELAAAAERLLGKSSLTAWGNCAWGALFGWRERQFEAAYGAAAIEAQQSMRWLQAAVLCALDVAACLVAGVYGLARMLQHGAEAAAVMQAAWALAAACACLWCIAAGLYVQRSLAAFYSSGKAATFLALLRLTMQLVHCWLASSDGMQVESFGSLRKVESGAEVAGVAAIAPALAAAVQFGSWAVCLVIVAARVVLHRLLPLWLLLHAALEAALVLLGLWRFEWNLKWEMLVGSPAWWQVLLAAARGVVIVVAVEAHSRVRFLYALQRRAVDGGVAALQGGQVTDSTAHFKRE